MSETRSTITGKVGHLDIFLRETIFLWIVSFGYYRNAIHFSLVALYTKGLAP